VIPNGYERSPFHKHIYTHPHPPSPHSSSKNEVNHSHSSVRISFQLHDPQSHPIENTFNLYVRCPLGEVMAGKKGGVATGEVRSGVLPPKLVRLDGDDGFDVGKHKRTGRVLDFTTSISTNLKILQIGDSVLVQLAQSFDEMIGGKELQSRNITWEAWNGHDGGTITAPTRGGGVSAMWRMTGLLSKSKKGRPPANSAGGGWSDLEIDRLLRYVYSDSDGKDEQQAKHTAIERFDVVVFRVMHGWMLIDEITHERLVEAIELANELLGATTVILMTIPFTNNVKTVEEMQKAEVINEDIREIAKSWHLRNETTGVKHVLVQEYGNYYNHIIWTNARHLGYNVSSPLSASQFLFDMEGPHFLYDRLNDGGPWSPSIPMVCSDMQSLEIERSKCNRNYLFSDGMHTCPEKLASRYGANLACLLGCIYNGRAGESVEDSSLRETSIRACELDCNRQFMSVMPVDDSWVDMKSAVASFALS